MTARQPTVSHRPSGQTLQVFVILAHGRRRADARSRIILQESIEMDGHEADSVVYTAVSVNLYAHGNDAPASP